MERIGLIVGVILMLNACASSGPSATDEILSTLSGDWYDLKRQEPEHCAESPIRISVDQTEDVLTVEGTDPIAEVATRVSVSLKVRKSHAPKHASDELQVFGFVDPMDAEEDFPDSGLRIGLTVLDEDTIQLRTWYEWDGVKQSKDKIDISKRCPAPA